MYVHTYICMYIYIIMCTHCDDDTRMSQHSGGKRSMPCQGSTAGISARALALDVWSLVHQGMITGRLELATVNVSGLVTLLPPLINVGDPAICGCRDTWCSLAS